MPTPGEHKTVQARILEYAEVIGWTFVSREEAEQRRGFDPDVLPKDRAKGRSLFFDDLLDAKVRTFNPRYAEAEGALLGQFGHLHTDSLPFSFYHVAASRGNAGLPVFPTMALGRGSALKHRFLL